MYRAKGNFFNYIYFKYQKNRLLMQINKSLPRLILFFVFSSMVIEAQSLEVNQSELESYILNLAKYGQKPNGEGNRVAFSDGDLEGRAYTIDLMKKAGLEVSIDFAGNIIGKREGKNPNAKPISFGSHVDMVPDGGNYDGCVGSMASIAVINVLNRNKIITEHPLELLIFSNEEGGVMGSRALVGALDDEALTVKNSTGYTMGEGMIRLGGDTSRYKEVRRKEGDLAAFLELHIEQGGILDSEKIDIGIVTGIVGLKWWNVEINGFANHAGTTPMKGRKDALITAAQFILAVKEVTNSFEGSQVGTVGRITAAPGAPNVIPGKVVLSLEIRDLSSEKIEKVYNAIAQKGQELAEANGTPMTFTPLSTTAEPALTAPTIQNTIAKVATKLGLSHKKMPSGAGHDAQDMAHITPTGMIFVPSKNGISHSPKEYTSPEDMANGANVLLQTILELDKSLE